MIKLETVTEQLMDVLFNAVGSTFRFHSNYTTDVDLPSLTVKVMPARVEPLTTEMVDYQYNVVLIIRQDESKGQDERMQQTHECYSSVFEAFRNGFKITDDITAVCAGFDLSFAGENYDVPEITFSFDFIDISYETETPTLNGNLEVDLKEGDET